MTATHTEAAYHHASILAAPLDDAPWLIYADWLDEHGQCDPAAKIRRWINAVKPAAIEAWERGGDRNLSGAARTLQATPGEWWRLAAVLGQRLTLERRPLDLSAVEWVKGWGPRRFLRTLGKTRHVVEMFAVRLVNQRQLHREYRAAYRAVHSAMHSAVASAVDSAVHSAMHSAAYSAVDSAAASAMHSAVHSAMHSAAYSAVDSAAASAVHSAMHSAVHSAVASAVDSAVASAVDSAEYSEVRQRFAAIYRAVAEAVR